MLKDAYMKYLDKKNKHLPSIPYPCPKSITFMTLRVPFVVLKIHNHYNNG